MELEFERDTIACWETVADTTLCQEETLESIVPDACPDILRIIDVCGQAVLTGKQAREGAAEVNGAVRAVILYQPEDGTGLRRMEVSLPFTCQTEAPGLTAQGFVAASPRLRCAEARMLNPRKVLLRDGLPAQRAAGVLRGSQSRGQRHLPAAVSGGRLPALFCAGKTLYIL